MALWDVDRRRRAGRPASEMSGCRRSGWDVEVPAPDEDHAPAGARTVPASLLHPRKAAATGSLSPSMHLGSGVRTAPVRPTQQRANASGAPGLAMRSWSSSRAVAPELTADAPARVPNAGAGGVPFETPTPRHITARVARDPSRVSDVLLGRPTSGASVDGAMLERAGRRGRAAVLGAAGRRVHRRRRRAGWHYRKQGTRWVAACGGVRPRRRRNLRGRCLSFAEREEIALARARGETMRAIAGARPSSSPSCCCNDRRKSAVPLAGHGGIGVREGDDDLLDRVASAVHAFSNVSDHVPRGCPHCDTLLGSRRSGTLPAGGGAVRRW
jgi:hypothetical protein